MVNIVVPQKYPQEFKYLIGSNELNSDTNLNAILNPKFTVEALGCS
jgi:hypothetical protein